MSQGRGRGSRSPPLSPAAGLGAESPCRRTPRVQALEHYSQAAGGALWPLEPQAGEGGCLQAAQRRGERTQFFKGPVRLFRESRSALSVKEAQSVQIEAI